MERIFRKILILMCAVVLFGALNVTASAATVASGSCGDNVAWRLDDSGTLTIYGSGAMWDLNDPSETGWYSYKDSVRNVVINYGVTDICGFVFSGYDNLTSVSIPNTVTSIGYAAFELSGLTGVVIPDSVTSIDDGAFYKCESLQRVTIGCGVSNIPWACFHGCSALDTIMFMDSMPTFSSAAFGYVTATAYYPGSNNTWRDVASQDYGGNGANITSVPYYWCGDSVIATLDSAGTLTISGSGDMWPYNMPSDYPWCDQRSAIRKVVIQSGVTSIAPCAFMDCYYLTSVSIPDSVTKIGGSAFECCGSLTSISLPDSITEIGGSAFYECGSLKSITIPSGVTRIGDYVFGYCRNLTSVTIPNSVICIGTSAFNSCTSLSSITIPGSVNQIDEWAFNYCTNLNTITFTGDAPVFTDVDGDGVTSVFTYVTATAYYPGDNSTWTADKLQNYGGNLTWKATGNGPVVTVSNVASTGKIKLTWKKVEGAAKYEVYRATSKTGTYTKLSTVTGTSLTNTSTTAGKTYYYKVRGVTSNGKKLTFSSVVSRTCDLPRPEVSVTNVASTGKIKLTWKKIDGAVKYEVYRATSKTGTYTKLSNVTGTSLTNTSTTAGKTYYYKVKAIHGNSNANSANSEIASRTCDLAQPVVKATNVASSGKIKLTWDKVSGAAKYEVYRATSKTGTYSKISTTTSTSLTNTSTTASKTYYYKVRAIHSNSSANSAYSGIVSRTCDLAQPAVKASNVASTGKIKLTWNKVEGAAKYEVYRATSQNGTYTKLTAVTGASCTNTSAKAGTLYFYKVKAIHSNSSANSAYSGVVSRTCDLAQPVVKASNVASTGKIKLSWNKVEGAAKYEVYRATSKTGSYSRISTTTSTSLTNTETTAGKTYYYKVRAIHSKSAANSADSSVVSRVCDLARPVLTVELNKNGKPLLSWTSVKGAVKYEVFRATSKDGTYTGIGTFTQTVMPGDAVTAGRTYYYKVRAIHSNADANSAYSEIKYIKSK